MCWRVQTCRPSADVRGAAAWDFTAAFEDFQMIIKGSYAMLNGNETAISASIMYKYGSLNVGLLHQSFLWQENNYFVYLKSKCDLLTDENRFCETPQ